MLREEYGLRMFEDRLLGRIFGLTKISNLTQKETA
jgi:hypothetical protein